MDDLEQLVREAKAERDRIMETPSDPTAPARLRVRQEDASRSDRKVLDLLDDVQTWRRVGAAFTRQEAEARAHNLRLIAEIAQQAADEAVAVWEAGNE